MTQIWKDAALRIIDKAKALVVKSPSKIVQEAVDSGKWITDPTEVTPQGPLHSRPHQRPWMYTMLKGGVWWPFEHRVTPEKISTMEIDCLLPKNARYYKHAARSGHRTILFPDEGGHIVAHSIMFPDGRVWNSTTRTLNQVYEPWKPTKN